jgi:hypothetical protein
VAKDSVTGLNIRIDGIRLRSGKTYTHKSKTGKRLLKMGQNSLATVQDYRGQYDYYENVGGVRTWNGRGDERIADEVDPITGYRPLNRLPKGASYKWKYEFNDKYLVATAQYTKKDVVTVSRVAWMGSMKYQGKKLTDITVKDKADTYVNGWGLTNKYTGGSSRLRSPVTKKSPFTFNSLDSGSVDSISTSSYWPAKSTREMKGLREFGNGKIFAAGWDSDPFSVNVL